MRRPRRCWPLHAINARRSEALGQPVISARRGPGGARRSLYFFAGSGVTVDGTAVPAKRGMFWDGAPAVTITNGDAPAELLMLQGRPIGEPVVQYGPFVMNSREEIQQAFTDYQRTQFGGWPWPAPDPVHAVDAGRFATRPDGNSERRG